ncbi:MAG: putative rRNA maturation factor [bacterium]|jgi:probable rRNA maturation factor
MVEFNYETTFQIEDENRLEKWIENVASKNGFEVGEINYIFCDDDYLLKLNVEFLKHDTLTDVISFDNTLGKLINGDIFISIERVVENAREYNDSFEDELHRVMVHGVLHYMGFRDKSDDEIKHMRTAENSALLLLNN